MPPMPCFSQSDPTWHLDTLGHGTPGVDTLGLYGCADTTFAALCQAWGVTRSATPRTINVFLTKTPGCFVDTHGKPGVLLAWENAAKAVGMKMLDAERTRGDIGDPKLVEAAANVFARKQICAFHVDHNSDVPGGDKNGDHFIAVAALIENTINEDGGAVAAHYLCMDPAPGAFMKIDPKTMQGTSLWNGKPKHFKVVSVIPCYL